MKINHMNESFIQKLARTRADKIFTPEYFQKVTDSWYLDEKFNFKGHQVGVEGRKPTEKEADIYMKYLDELFDQYKDKFYGGPLAQDAYGKCIDHIDKILKIIEYGKQKFHLFEVDDETIQRIKDIGNIFVTKHNEFCK